MKSHNDFINEALANNEETIRIKENVSIASFEQLAKRNLQLTELIKKMNHGNVDFLSELLFEIDGLKEKNKELNKDFKSLTEEYKEELSHLEEYYKSNTPFIISFEDDNNSSFTLGFSIILIISLLSNLTTLTKENKNNG